ncbi:MAG TPA: DUF1684 domain-containing protein [Anaerolineales bacterium]|nr:DUF1684 domain-containing protein [Anaerolineales bacterium]
MDAAYLDALREWRERKDDDLRRRDSWLALAGLHWLAEGRHSAGSGAACAIHLPRSAPPVIGEFEVRGGRVWFHASASLPPQGLPAAVGPLLPDTADDPTYLRLGDITIVVIKRGDRVGLRIWDNQRLASTKSVGRTWYSPNAAYLVRCAFEDGEEGATIPVPDVTGAVHDERLLGTARFEIAGRREQLRAVPADDFRLQFLFADPTNGLATYPAGRFLVADPAVGGIVTLDFNRAYNPPCAFTDFATCPLPPQGNRLATPIEAGETYGHAA